MIELKTPGELDAMRLAGKVVATALQAVRSAAGVGTSLRELDEVAADVLADAGARSSFLHYHPGFAPSPYPAVLCTSVNDAVVHGIPTAHRLADGDLLSIDFGAEVDGWHGDAAVSFVVGTPRQADLDLIATTERALDAGIAAARPGNRLGDIGHAIGTVGRSAGYGLLADHGGHGVGRAMHEAPHVPNEATAGTGLGLRPGMVLAIEPMFVAGGVDAYRLGEDGWTLFTADGSRAAHVEHTVAITADGPRILTAP
ncbi:type I methionyl aminopeptidase [Prauserella muralis]|uniref:Methionine aminopeptidase n=1 Tax=Prauserella muralis TaxID=588067 RepID=A0A2V4AN06_9PSEU|nr:type I methionyl aminopeptidase [Prauserella muralis]PXY21433.1 type I methionyl aminopeptidase [Prauserella muralis]